MNVSCRPAPPGLTVADLAALGVRRISVGGALARVAWKPIMRVAKQIMDEGHFDGLSDSTPNAELNALFRDGLKTRS